MKRLIVASLSAVALAACSTDNAPLAPATEVSPSVGRGTTVIVTHGYAAGKGTLRAAIDAANADARITHIEIKPANMTITLDGSVTYTGTQSLTIVGKRTTIDASAVAGSALVSTSGADLSIESLTIRDAGQQGLEVQIPMMRTGTVSVRLHEFAAIGNVGHGVLINEQKQPDTDAPDFDPSGSDASLAVQVSNSRFAGNGNSTTSVIDRDGLRVNEGGLGDLTLTASNVIAEDNGADGIELDERGAGDVLLDVSDTQILRNGERYDVDLDDGFDVDEYDTGGIIGTVVRTKANDNFEEGLDFNENDLGDLRVDLTDVEASRNREEGIDYEEDDDNAVGTGGGSIETTMINVIADGNGVDGGDGGVRIREKLEGNLVATLTNVRANGNVARGISIREDANGFLISTVAQAEAKANGNNGIEFDERGSGDLTAEVQQSVAMGNTGVGVRANQATPGTGKLTLTAVTLSGNTAGNTGGNVSPMIVP